MVRRAALGSVLTLLLAVPGATYAAHGTGHDETVPPNEHNDVGACAASSRPVGGNQGHFIIAEFIQATGEHPCQPSPFFGGP